MSIPEEVVPGMRSSGELALPSLVTSTTSDPIDPAADSSRLLESLARSIREGRRSTDRDGGAGAPARNPRAGAAALARVREIAARAGFPDLDALGARAAVGPRDGGRKRKRDEGDADAAADGLVERWRRRLGPGARAAGGAGHVAVAAPSSSEEGRAGPDAAPSPASATSQGAAFQGHMRAWLKANWQNPFPDDVTLHRLADHMINLDCIGLSNKDTDRLLVREVCSVEEQRDVAVAAERRDIAVAKVTNWLANARSRSWRPSLAEALEARRPAALLLEDSLNLYEEIGLRPVDGRDGAAAFRAVGARARRKAHAAGRGRRGGGGDGRRAARDKTALDPPSDFFPRRRGTSIPRAWRSIMGISRRARDTPSEARLPQSSQRRRVVRVCGAEARPSSVLAVWDAGRACRTAFEPR